VGLGKGLFRPWPVGRRNGKGGKVVEGLDFEEVCFPYEVNPLKSEFLKASLKDFEGL